MITLTAVTKSFDGRPALVDANLSLPSGGRTAVVGVNGSGKSTLLQLAAGLLIPESGTVSVALGATIAHVPQDYALDADLTVAEYVKARAGVLDVERELRRLERAMADGDPAAPDAYAAVLERYAALGGYELEGRSDRVLAELGLPAGAADRRVGTLSGGQQVRVGLAGVLASRCSVYLLDEPTNNLDPEALDLLERFVVGTDATFLLVSHDRAFLDAVATDVIEIDEHTHTPELHGLTFAEYREVRARQLAARSQRYREYAVEVDRLTAAARSARAAAGKTRDTRPARDNDKLARYFLAQAASRQAGRAARTLERRLARLPAVDEPRTGWELRLALGAGARSGDLVAELTRVTRTLGSFTLGPLSVALHWRERVALQGHNGAGKSVLLGLLTGAERPDAGEVRLGAGVQVGVLRQGGTDLAGPATGLAAFLAQVPATTPAQARTLLAKFDLGAEHVLRPTATYSPGERCRLGLAVLMARGANCLVLDEPTNHLDLEATEELERALLGYDGTLVVVSHDREFLDRIGTTRRLELRDGRLVADSPV